MAIEATRSTMRPGLDEILSPQDRSELGFTGFSTERKVHVLRRLMAAGQQDLARQLFRLLAPSDADTVITKLRAAGIERLEILRLPLNSTPSSGSPASEPVLSTVSNLDSIVRASPAPAGTGSASLAGPDLRSAEPRAVTDPMIAAIFEHVPDATQWSVDAIAAVAKSAAAFDPDALQAFASAWRTTFPVISKLVSAVEQAKRQAGRSLDDAEVQRLAGDQWRALEAARAEPRSKHLRADHKVWTTTYWPFADLRGTGDGDPAQNLWAKGGSLEKLDELRESRGTDRGAQAHEHRSAVGSMVGASGGYWLPSPELRESDAETTTGLELNGDGEPTKDVKHDFIDAFGQFGEDGRSDGTMDVGWWGNCDKVALAGLLFEDPKHDVEMDIGNGKKVTFTQQDIRGLLSVIADAVGGSTTVVGDRKNGLPDIVTLKDGTRLQGHITNMSASEFRAGAVGVDFNFPGSDDDTIQRTRITKDIKIKIPKDDGTAEPKILKAADVQSATRETKKDFAPWFFLDSLRDVIGAKKRPIAGDHDSSSHVWNDNWDGADITRSTTAPTGVDIATLNGIRGDIARQPGDSLMFYDVTLLKDTNENQNYKMWVQRNAAGNPINGAFLGKNYPDFMWWPAVGDAVAVAKSNPHNSRNPFVEPKTVMEIYEKSIA